MLRLTPPTVTTFIVSVILADVAIAGHYSHKNTSQITINLFWLAVIDYFVLFLGNVIRGI